MTSQYQMCVRCVMDTSDPEIQFDAGGVCNHCRRAEQLLRNGYFPNEEGRRRLDRIAAEIRGYGDGREYDCIIGVSGGVDSSYLLHVAKHVMNLRPLAVHVDAGWNSEIAVRNIETLVKALGIDLFTYVVDWPEIRDLQLAFLKSSVANQDIPQDHAFFAKLYEFAIKNDIRYVLTGSNLTSESILPSSWGYDATDKRQLMAIHRRFGTGRLRTYPTMSFWQYHVYWPFVKRMRRVAPLNFLPYDKEQAITELESMYGWRYYGGKHHESHWTKFFQTYFLPEKFGYDKRKAHLSSLIIAGQMTREAACEELAKPLYDPAAIREERDYVARKLGISLGELDALMALPNRSFRDYPNNEALISRLRSVKHAVAGRRR